MTVSDYEAQRGAFALDTVVHGDSTLLVPRLPDGCVDVVVTSPPYWGQRISPGVGVEEDPRDYLSALVAVFAPLLDKLSDTATVWINTGDTYNTPLNWSEQDRPYSTLGRDAAGLPAGNSAYTKPRPPRKAFVDHADGWLTRGGLLGLPHRLAAMLCEHGYLLRGEVVWSKPNALPEGRCRRPHRTHELILLFAKTAQHSFRVAPPVKSVWNIAPDRIGGPQHHSRFPVALPAACLDAHGSCGEDTLVLDPFAGSATTGVAAKDMGARFVGFELDSHTASTANERLAYHAPQLRLWRPQPQQADSPGPARLIFGE